MSSTEDLDLVYQCLRDGADHYILKPLKEEHLKNFTQNVYRKKHEAEVIHQLKSEQHKSTELEEKTVKLETEVAELKVVRICVQISHFNYRQLIKLWRLQYELYQRRWRH